MDKSIFEQLGNNSDKIFFTFSLSAGRFTYLSKAAEQVMKGGLNQALQEPGLLLPLVHPDDRIPVSNFYGRLVHGTAGTIKFRLQNIANQDKMLKVEAAPVYNDAGELTAVAGIAEDITDPDEYLAYLLEFGRKKNSTLEILAHDLQGPLAMVQGLANALDTDMAQQDYSEIRNYTNIIRKACDTCLTLIRNLLKEEHLRSPAVVVNKERVELVQKVKEVLEFYKLNKSIKQKFELHAPPKVYAIADVVKLDQVLNNLISNSLKFTHADGTISFAIEQEGERVLIKQSDNGIGIPQELMPYLFEKYTRASREGLHGEKFSGIGLSIIKELVELQGGNVWCESQENVGSTFFIRLPAATV